MKIVIDARWIFPELSGIGLYTQELIRALAQLDRQHEYVLLFQYPEVMQRVVACAGLVAAPNFRTELVPFGIFSLASQIRLPGLLRRWGADVFHSPNYMIPFRAFPRCGRRTHCVVTIHDLIPLLFPEWTPKAKKTRLLPMFRCIMQAVGVRADLILTVSEASRRDILRVMRIPAARQEKVLAIPNGVAAEYQPPATPQTGARKKTILYVGRFDPYKNVIGLLVAFEQLRRQMPGAVRLVIAGAPDPRYPEALAFARRHNLETDIEWRGYLNGRQLVEAYQQADVFVLPSRYEGFGLTVLEAMACGTPVVCSNVSSLPEVAGDAAILVAPDDATKMTEAIRRVLTEPELAATLREKGVRRAAEFSWRRTAEMTLRAYASSLKGAI
ncbi:MAG: glycosyltransferase family 1 protein [Verrucomicrobia bacterium]|nr:MAG: glycosyltransferase family 1 protein [Verrucomicrobiota bacterium]